MTEEAPESAESVAKRVKTEATTQEQQQVAEGHGEANEPERLDADDSSSSDSEDDSDDSSSSVFLVQLNFSLDSREEYNYVQKIILDCKPHCLSNNVGKWRNNRNCDVLNLPSLAIVTGDRVGVCRVVRLVKSAAKVLVGS